MTDDLPLLPEPTIGLGAHRWAYGEKDMRAYGDARAAAEQERALDAVDECPGLTMKQDRWLSAAIRASAKPAPAHGAAPDTPRTSRTP